MSENKTVGQRIKTVRQEKGMTQAQLADHEDVHVTKNYIYLIESGRTVPAEKLVKDIAKAFGISAKWLLTGEGSKHIIQSKDEEISSFLHSVLKDEPEVFRRRLVAAMAKWTEQDWETLAHLAETITEGK